MSAEFAYVIIGAGMGGVGMGLRLLQEGETNFIILERAERVGGTWRDNVYPGCSCDVPSHLYWFDFTEQQPDWSRRFAFQPEILGHLEQAVEDSGLKHRIRLGETVKAAEWDEEAISWRVTLASGDVLTTRILVSATGQLGEPSYRGIPGRETFNGAAFHSARWNPDAVLDGKRVAVIGSGASAAQIVPEVAKVAGELIVCQRSAPYIIPREDGPFSAEERALFRSQPEAMRRSRAEFFEELEMRFETLRPGSDGARMADEMARTMLETQVQDSELQAKLTPDYTLGCKRPVISDDYLPTFNRPNVRLVMQAVERIEPTGVRAADGMLHEADVIVFATGFESLKFLNGIDVRGRDGLSLHDGAWAEAVRAYLGMTIPHFPNLFLLYGPNTNLNHNSIIAMFDSQIEYILGAGREALANPGLAFDLKAEVLEEFDRELQAGLATSVFVTGCNSWYIGEGGRIVTNWWGRVTDYHARTKRFDPESYDWIEKRAVRAKI